MMAIHQHIHKGINKYYIYLWFMVHSSSNLDELKNQYPVP